MTILFRENELIIGSATIPENVTFRFSDILKLGGGGSSPSWQDIVLSGNGSLTLTNAKANGINYVKLFGDCEQDGTPTPTTPVDIVCNNGALRARHQSGLPFGYQPYEYITANGNKWLNTGVQLASTDIVETEFKNNSSSGYGALYGVFALGDSSAFYANGTYYGYDVANGKVNTGISVNTEWHTLRQDFGNGVITLDGNDTTYTPFEFENTNDNYLFARYYNTSYGYGFKGSCKRFKVIRNGVLICDLIPVVQLSDNAVGMYDLVNNVFRGNLGTGDFDISNPINDLEIYYDGDVETVTVKPNERENHFVQYINGYLRISTRTLMAYSGNSVVTFDCEVGKTYCCINRAMSGIATMVNIGYSDTIPTAGYVYSESDFVATSIVDGDYKTTGLVFTAKKRYVTFIFRYDNDSSKTPTSMLDDMIFYEITNAQTATAQPLLSVGTYKDVQNVTTGAITRNVGVKVFDGSEDWRYRSNYNLFSLANIGMESNGQPLATHFPYKTFTTIADYGVGYIYTNNLFIKNTDCADLTNFKQFLADQYAQGTPVIIVYPLATPTTETVTGQTLHLQAGTNIVEITQASIDNLPLEVSYKGTIEQQGE